VRVGGRLVVYLGFWCSPNRKLGSFLSTNHNEYRGRTQRKNYALGDHTTPRAPAWSKINSLGGVVVSEVSTIGEKKAYKMTILTFVVAKMSLHYPRSAITALFLASL
jgi:hypothetical protein